MRDESWRFGEGKGAGDGDSPGASESVDSGQCAVSMPAGALCEAAVGCYLMI